MVVLMEEFGGLSLKRKGADEPELFDVGGDDRSGFPLSCRATKMRRLAGSDNDGRHHAPAVGGGGAAEQQVDLPMGDAAAPSPVPGAGGEDERAVVLYGGGGGPSDAAAQSVPLLQPVGAHVHADAADWLRAMLREADSRTVRELLSGAQEQRAADLALALVPWVPPAEEAESFAAAEPVNAEDSDGAAAMDVEEEDEGQVQQWTRQAFSGAGCGEGYAYRWPQHCMAPPQLPAVGQASPVMWSW